MKLKQPRSREDLTQEYLRKKYLIMGGHLGRKNSRKATN